MCCLQRETEEHQSSLQPRDSRGERTGELGGRLEAGSREGVRRHLAPSSCCGLRGARGSCFPVQVYRERQKYCKEWRKRKRMVSITATRETAAQQHGPARWCSHLKRGGFVSCQATELSDAILEGYPKSKKQFFVSGSPSCPCSPGCSPRRAYSLVSLPQEEVGIETDEDYNVKLPDP